MARILALKAHFLHCDCAYYLPTYGLVSDIAFKRFPELLERKGWAYKLNRGSAVLSFPNAGEIIFRTMEKPERIVGYEVAHSICDELDTLPIDKARAVWERVISRNRQKTGSATVPNSVAVATTPEGFRFVYEMWVKNPKQGYSLFRAKTSDNAANLPDGYIDNLIATYPENRLSAYLDGEFVNLTSGSVYPMFDRIKNASKESIKQDDILHIGMDFNVGNMAASVHVLRDDKPHAVDEIVGQLDTPTIIKSIKRRWPAHRVFIYPDASGGNRKSQDASQSDLHLLRQAGFHVLSNPSNPAVRDRVLSVCKLLEAGDYRINLDKCPSLVDSLEKQAYDKNGSPDKSSGLDHIIDAAGYFIAHRYPIRAGKAAHQKLLGF